MLSIRRSLIGKSRFDRVVTRNISRERFHLLRTIDWIESIGEATQATRLAKNQFTCRVSCVPETALVQRNTRSRLGMIIVFSLSSSTGTALLKGINCNQTICILIFTQVALLSSNSKFVFPTICPLLQQLLTTFWKIQEGGCVFPLVGTSL